MKRSRKDPESSSQPPKAAAGEEPRHYFKEMRFQQLRSFCEVARFGSFAGAARALHVSRPAIWQQIRSLERELDASLVVRQGRKAELTGDGLALLDNALLTPLAEACRELQRDDFMLMVAPLVIEGGTGSPVNPIAVF